MALDALIGKVSLLAGRLPSNLELSTSCTGSRFSVRLDRWHELVIEGGSTSSDCVVPEQLLCEVVNLNGCDPEGALQSLHDRLFCLVDLGGAA